MILFRSCLVGFRRYGLWIIKNLSKWGFISKLFNLSKYLQEQIPNLCKSALTIFDRVSLVSLFLCSITSVSYVLCTLCFLNVDLFLMLLHFCVLSLPRITIIPQLVYKRFAWITRDTKIEDVRKGTKIFRMPQSLHFVFPKRKSGRWKVENWMVFISNPFASNCCRLVRNHS